MPVEIKELIIRAIAQEDRAGVERVPGNQTFEDQKEAIVEACVKQVLRILKRSKER